MRHHVRQEELRRVNTIGEVAPELRQQMERWYAEVFAPGALTAREKALIALAVAHAVACAHCIETYTRESLDQGAGLPEMREAVNVAAAVRGGGALLHGVQQRRVRLKAA